MSLSTKVNQQSIDLANVLAYKVGGQIGGSFIVDRENANDIDVFTSRTAFARYCDKRVFGEEPYSFEQGVTFDRKQWDDCDRYQESNKDDALVCTYRSDAEGFNVNLIIVNDEYVVAFQAATNAMRRTPELFKDREARIKLHHGYRERIREMLYGVTPADIIPW